MSTITLPLRQRCEHIPPPKDCIIPREITDILIQGLQLSLEIQSPFIGLLSTALPSPDPHTLLPRTAAGWRCTLRRCLLSLKSFICQTQPLASFCGINISTWLLPRLYLLYKNIQ